MLGITQQTIHNLEAIPFVFGFVALFIAVLIGAEKATRREEDEFNAAIADMTPIEVVEHFIEPEHFEVVQIPRNRNHGRPKGRKAATV